MAIVATVVFLIIRPWSARRMYLGATAVALAASATAWARATATSPRPGAASGAQRAGGGAPTDHLSTSPACLALHRPRRPTRDPVVSGPPLLTSHQMLGNLSRNMRAERGCHDFGYEAVLGHSVMSSCPCITQSVASLAVLSRAAYVNWQSAKAINVIEFGGMRAVLSRR